MKEISLWKKLKLGDRFGRLVILKERKQKAKDGHRVYICKCDCGNLKEVVSRELLNEDTQSCGCYRIEQMVKKDLLKAPNQIDLMEI